VWGQAPTLFFYIERTSLHYVFCVHCGKMTPVKRKLQSAIKAEVEDKASQELEMEVSRETASKDGKVGESLEVQERSEEGPQ